MITVNIREEAPFAAAKAVEFEMSPFVNPQTNALQNGRWF